MANHVTAIDRELVELAAGRNKRLIIQMPPRHGKSELCSKYFPAWYLGVFPHKNVILTSATDDLAMDFSVAARDLISEHGHLFGTSLRPDRASAQRWGTTDGGGLRAAGVGGAIMGRGADLLIIDDYFKNVEEALSETIRRKMYQWYLTTSRSRLSPTGAQVIIATRWHFNDLIGEILATAEKTGEEWRTINFPAIGDDGAALWPEQWPLELLEPTKRGYYESGYPWMWEALYQQVPPETMDTEWPPEYFADIWSDYWPPENERVITVVALDPSVEESDKSDYSAFVAVCKGHDGKYYVDANIDRRDIALIVERGVEWMRDIRPDAFGCETNQFQKLLLPMFRRALPGIGIDSSQIFGIKNTSLGSRFKDQKRTRIRSLTRVLAEGRLKIRRSPGSSLLVEQLKGFPSHKHDDGPDALEMAIRLAEELLHGSGYAEPEPEVLYA
jgi:predicted phage terminase large subunit-like protein